MNCSAQSAREKYRYLWFLIKPFYSGSVLGIGLVPELAARRLKECESGRGLGHYFPKDGIELPHGSRHVLRRKVRVSLRHTRRAVSQQLPSVREKSSFANRAEILRAPCSPHPQMPIHTSWTHNPPPSCPSY